MNKSNHNPIRFWSKMSGISLLIMAVTAGYAYGFSFNQIYVVNNPVQTLINIESNNTLFITGALAWCVILITDLIVSYGFYRFLKPIHKRWAITSGLLRLIYSLFLAVGILHLISKDLEGFRLLWSQGLFIIGFHLIATGLGTFHSEKVPNLLGILLIIAGTGYSLIHGLENFTPQNIKLVNTLVTILAIPMTIGELSFGIWLLIRGGRTFTQQPSNAPVQDVL